MAGSLDRFEELGARVTTALEATAPTRARAIEDARRGFLAHAATGNAGTGGMLAGRWPWVGAATAVALAATLVFSITHRHTPLTFDVDGSAGVAKIWLAAPESTPLQLKFSEGTQVRLEAASRGRVVDIDAHGASLALEGGRLHAEVVHKSDAAWKVVAGPFTVNVTGTIFDVNWNPSLQQLSVNVSRGSVSVRDSSTGAEQAVRATETLRATVSGHRFALTTAESGAELAPSSPARPVASDEPEALNPDPNDPHAREIAATGLDNRAEGPLGRNEDSHAEWREFAKRGALREAFASAEAAGFARTCASASPAELLLLGDGARLSGNAERASQALLSLRRHYPRDPRRAAAAFALGKVAFDQRRAYEQAAEWFSTSLREQPRGPLSREASGRLIEALRRAGNAAGAQRAARDYLTRYPEGPHADLARSVLR